MLLSDKRLLNLQKIDNISSKLIYFFITTLAISIPVSKFGMSISQFGLLIFWLFEGISSVESSVKNGNFLKIFAKNLKSKYKAIVNNPVILALISIYLLHIIGCLYSYDTYNMLKDLRIKLPIISMPIILGTIKPLSSKQLKNVLILFVLSVFTATLISIYIYLSKEINNFREISIFISHIRFSLNISLSIFIAYYLLKHYNNNKYIKKLLLILIIWFSVFILFMNSLSGISITLAVIILLFFKLFIKNGNKIAVYSMFTIALLLVVVFTIYFVNTFNGFYYASKVDFNKIQTHTLNGNLYTHDTTKYRIANGEYTGLYICENELINEWQKRSNYNIDSLDNKGNNLKSTLISYLASKKLKKDSIGIANLTDEDIKNIEKGYDSHEITSNFNLKSRINEIAIGLTNYIKSNNPNGSSLMQRIEYWKTSIWIIKNNFLIGVGTGDVKMSFSNAYTELNSNLLPEYRFGSHNEFLYITISLGIIGLIIFLFSLFYPPIFLHKFNNVLYFCFFIIAFLSMIPEDTLETQAGVTFISFFNALFLFFLKPKNNEQANSYY